MLVDLKKDKKRFFFNTFFVKKIFCFDNKFKLIIKKDSFLKENKIFFIYNNEDKFFIGVKKSYFFKKIKYNLVKYFNLDFFLLKNQEIDNNDLKKEINGKI